MKSRSLLAILLIFSFSTFTGNTASADEFERETQFLFKKLNHMGSSNLNKNKTFMFNLKVEQAKASFEYKAKVNTKLDYSIDSNSLLLSFNFSW